MYMKASCVLDASLTTVTDSQGHFEFSDVPDGSYMLLYDNTIDDFEMALAEWDGQAVKVGHFDRQVEELPSYGDVFFMVLNEPGTKFSEADLAADMLLARYVIPPDCPFLVATTLDVEALVLTPVIVEAKAGDVAEVDIQIFGSQQQ
jgi:hypothetical protein